MIQQGKFEVATKKESALIENKEILETGWRRGGGGGEEGVGERNGKSQKLEIAV